MQLPDLLTRGVYTAPFLSPTGSPLAVGVTSKGCFVGMLPFTTDAEERAVRRALWAILDEADSQLLRAI
jgi:murein endopeptidase